jgi:hypothetical protein
LNKIGISDFFQTGIKPSADTFHSRINILANALNSAGMTNKLSGGVLIGHLKNVVSATEDLKKYLEKWGINNPILGHRLPPHTLPYMTA